MHGDNNYISPTAEYEPDHIRREVLNELFKAFSPSMVLNNGKLRNILHIIHLNEIPGRDVKVRQFTVRPQAHDEIKHLFVRFYQRFYNKMMVELAKVDTLKPIVDLFYSKNVKMAMSADIKLSEGNVPSSYYFKLYINFGMVSKMIISYRFVTSLPTPVADEVINAKHAERVSLHFPVHSEFEDRDQIRYLKSENRVLNEYPMAHVENVVNNSRSHIDIDMLEASEYSSPIPTTLHDAAHVQMRYNLDLQAEGLANATAHSPELAKVRTLTKKEKRLYRRKSRGAQTTKIGGGRNKKRIRLKKQVK